MLLSRSKIFIMKETIRGQLVAIQDGIYTNYVFKNLDESENSELRYITVTRCPNWQYNDVLSIGDIGFIMYEFAEAGQEYINNVTGETKKYRYTANYFMNFIKEKTIKDNTKEFNC